MKRLFLLLVLIIATGAFWWFAQGGGPARQQSADAQTPRHNRPEAAIPVVLAQAKQMTLPLSFATIGTIQPIASIPVTSQVSGIVSKVAVNDGDEVRQGDVLVELDARMIDAQIAQGQASLIKDQANIDKAVRDLARVNKLLAGKFETPENAADAQTTLDLAKATLQSDQAALQDLEVQREYYTIRAPVSGRIGTVPVKPGSTIVSGGQASPIVTVNSFDPIYVAVGIPQKMIADLAQDKTQGAARVSLTVPGRGDKRDGQVTVIDNAANPATGLVTVLASIANTPAVLWPGEIVNVDVVFHDQSDVLAVPNEAIRTNQQGTYVYAVDDQQHAHVKPVVVARSVKGLSVVSSGLTAGDNVVVDGQLLLSDGALISIKQAMAGG